MKLILKPTVLPFNVGDVVWVNRCHLLAQKEPYFQAKIMQIILDGSMNGSMVIRHTNEVHELVISSAIYDLKPLSDYSSLPRVSIQVQLCSLQKILFESQEELLDYHNYTA